MDVFDGSAPPISVIQSNEENLNSAPPQIESSYPSEDEIKKNQETKDSTTSGDNNNNENNNNQEEDDDEYVPVRPIVIHHHYEPAKARLIAQSIFCILIYGCSIWGISLNSIYGINYSLIDDIILFLLASIMLYLTIRKRTTCETKLGVLTLILTFLGFVVRGLATAFFNIAVLKFVVLLIIRTLILVFCTTFNCNEFCG